MDPAELRRRVAQGFAAETDTFCHTVDHSDHCHAYPSRFTATNDEAVLQGECFPSCRRVHALSR